MNKSEAKEMLEVLSDEEIEKEVEKVVRVDPLTSLKLNLFSFFESRLKSIEEEDNFEQAIKKAIVDKIVEDELSTSQLMQLYSSVKAQGSRSLEVLLDVFKPTPSGNVSPLVEGASQRGGNSDGNSINEFKDLNPQERDTLHKFSKLINEMHSAEDKNPNSSE